jgi:hypothetical protein
MYMLLNFKFPHGFGVLLIFISYVFLVFYNAFSITLKTKSKTTCVQYPGIFPLRHILSSSGIYFPGANSGGVHIPIL